MIQTFLQPSLFVCLSAACAWDEPFNGVLSDISRSPQQCQLWAGAEPHILPWLLITLGSCQLLLPYEWGSRGKPSLGLLSLLGLAPVALPQPLGGGSPLSQGCGFQP